MSKTTSDFWRDLRAVLNRLKPFPNYMQLPFKQCRQCLEIKFNYDFVWIDKGKFIWKCPKCGLLEKAK